MTNYQERERDDTRCSNPRCKQESEISLLSGATVLNPNYGIQLCDPHHEVFSDALHAYYEAHPEERKVVRSAFPQVIDEPDRTKASTTVDLKGMWA